MYTAITTPLSKRDVETAQQDIMKVAKSMAKNRYQKPFAKISSYQKPVLHNFHQHHQIWMFQWKQAKYAYFLPKAGNVALAQGFDPPKW